MLNILLVHHTNINSFRPNTSISATGYKTNFGEKIAKIINLF